MVDGTLQWGRRQSWLALAVLVVVVVAAFLPTWAAMARTWQVDTTFSHCILIVPMAMYLAWRKREVLAAVPVAPSPIGLALLVPATITWILGHAVHLRLLEQIGVVGMLQATVPLALGWRATRVLVFPLAFLLFLVPAGKELVPQLMEVTADLAVFFLRLTGVPVYRDGMLLYIPAGAYEVARTCSGIKFLTAAIAIGTFFGYVMYGTLRKRMWFVAIAVLVAIFSNGLRAYLLVLIGHLTDMRFEHDRWHIVLGYVVFGTILLLLIYFGSRFQDAAPQIPGSVDRRPRIPETRMGAIAWPLLGALVLVSGAAYGRMLLTLGGSREAIARMSAPVAAAPGWESWVGQAAWLPDFRGGSATSTAAYGSGDGVVDLYVAVYELPGREGAEMISYSNQIQRDANERLYSDHVRDPGLGTGFRLRETTAGEPRARLVWYWYDVAGAPAVSGPRAKLLEMKAVLMGRRGAQRVVVISTQLDDREAAAGRLRSFLQAHPLVLPAGTSD